MAENILEIINISKSFGDNAVLHDLCLKIQSGEFITLLGSSGCGKTTLLRIIAGLETPDQGQIILEGQDISAFPPNKRDMSMVFQNYALFPHMNVGANIAYSLKLKKVDKNIIKEAVNEALALVRLEGFEARMPGELSGGQKQRVAIARSIIGKPKLLLLDEPLGALDLQLRRQMQTELKRLQKQLGITFIYITHDQEEALNMSSRIVIMREGHFEQIGTPSQIYDSPQTSYTATFVGNANLIEGIIQSLDPKHDIMLVKCENCLLEAPMHQREFKINEQIRLAIRSENILFTDSSNRDALPAIVTERTFVGGQLRLNLKTDHGLDLVASRHGLNLAADVGDRVHLFFEAKHVIPVDIGNF